MDYILKSTQYILLGSGITLKLMLITITISMPLGFLCAIGKNSRFIAVRVLMDMYTSIVRGTPLLLQLFFVYYGLPLLIPGLRFERFNAAALTFVINYGSYFTEIFRGGIQSIEKGQYEAARALAMSNRQTMIRIILPQTVKRVLPPVANEAITLVKDTALVTVLGIGDILRNSKEIVSRDFTIVPFVIAAVIYLTMNYLMVLLFKALEKRYSVYE